jgi:hypothetical protein
MMQFSKYPAVFKEQRQYLSSIAERVGGARKKIDKVNQDAQELIRQRTPRDPAVQNPAVRDSNQRRLGTVRHNQTIGDETAVRYVSLSLQERMQSLEAFLLHSETLVRGPEHMITDDRLRELFKQWLSTQNIAFENSDWRPGVVARVLVQNGFDIAFKRVQGSTGEWRCCRCIEGMGVGAIL